MKVWLVGIILAFTASSAFASSSSCNLRVLHTVAAVENPDSVLQAGQEEGDVTQYAVNKATGADTFCFHGGYCYPAHIQKGGAQVEALKLSNCEIDKSQPFDSDGELLFDVAWVDALNSDEDNQFNKVERRLSEAGLCSACADNAARTFLENPTSECGRLVGRFMSGDKGAASQIDVTGICTNSADRPQTSPSPALSEKPEQHISGSRFGNLITGILALVALLYFIPTGISLVRTHHQTAAIFVLNLLLGWTFLGWICALVWSFTAKPTPPQVIVIPEGMTDPEQMRAMVEAATNGNLDISKLDAMRGL